MNFKEILIEVQKHKKPIKTYPSSATEYLGVSRRGWKVVEAVNKMLEEYDVLCEPEFRNAWFYGQIEIKPKPKVSASKQEGEMFDTDPTPRISQLRAANLNKIKEQGEGTGLISLNRDSLLSEATALMLFYDYSQLPIITNNKVDGIISWKSIGRALTLGKICNTVSDCKDEVMVLNYDDALFSAVKYISEKEVVLIRQKELITGIVTMADIGEQFIALAEPFLIIEQIENHIRKLLDQKFSEEELIALTTIEINTKPKVINSLSELNFGDYVKILEDPKKFEKLKINIDRKLIVRQLDEVRKIRNDVMHFDPEGITKQNLELLRQTVLFLHTLTTTLRVKSKT